MYGSRSDISYPMFTVVSGYEYSDPYRVWKENEKIRRSVERMTKHQFTIPRKSNQKSNQTIPNKPYHIKQTISKQTKKTKQTKQTNHIKQKIKSNHTKKIKPVWSIIQAADLHIRETIWTSIQATDLPLIINVDYVGLVKSGAGKSKKFQVFAGNY